MTSIKPKIETKSIKHTFTPEEIAKLNVDFGQAFDAHEWGGCGCALPEMGEDV